jgi:hypothetical protein
MREQAGDLAARAIVFAAEEASAMVNEAGKFVTGLGIEGHGRDA